MLLAPPLLLLLLLEPPVVEERKSLAFWRELAELLALPTLLKRVSLCSLNPSLLCCCDCDEFVAESLELGGASFFLLVLLTPLPVLVLLPPLLLLLLTPSV